MKALQTVKGKIIGTLGVVSTGLVASGANAAIDVTPITNGQADILSLAAAAVTLGVAAFGAWAIYYKLKG